MIAVNEEGVAALKSMSECISSGIEGINSQAERLSSMIEGFDRIGPHKQSILDLAERISGEVVGATKPAETLIDKLNEKAEEYQEFIDIDRFTADSGGGAGGGAEGSSSGGGAGGSSSGGAGGSSAGTKGILSDVAAKIGGILSGIGILSGGGKDGGSEYVAEPVNVCTGNYVSDVKEISFSGALKLEFIRHYNAMYREAGCMGIGWTHNYDIFLKENGDTIDLCMGDRWRERFADRGDGLYTGQNGSKDYIRKNNGYICCLKNENTLIFNEEHKLVMIRSDRGEKILLKYTADRLTEAMDTAGRKLFYHYEGDLLTSVTDSTGRKVELEYAGDGLTLVRSADGSETAYAYDSELRLRSIIKAGKIMAIENEYDEKDRIIRQKMADGSVMMFKYDNTDTIVTDRDGSVTTYRHDDRMRITEIISRDGSMVYEYDDAGNRTLVRTREGLEYRREYDEHGNLAAVISPMGGRIRLSYDQNDLPITVEDENGAVTRMEYDQNGDLIRFTDELGHVTVLEYIDRRLTWITYADGSREGFEYDGIGNISAHIDEMGNKIRYVYDDAGRKIKETDADDRSRMFAYDQMDRLIRITNEMGASREFEYGETGKPVRIIDYDGNSESWTYDEMEQIISYTDKEGRVTRYSYDQMSNPMKILLPNEGSICFTYDQYGRKTSMVDAEGRKTIYEYDRDGRMTGKKEGNRYTQYVYDSRGQNVAVIEDGASRTVERNGKGLVTALIHPDGSRFSYQYDAAGQCISRIDPAGREKRYEYDPGRRLAAIIDGDTFRTKYAYYPNGRIKEVRYPDDTAVSFTYDAAGNITKKEYSGGYAVFCQYDEMNRCIRREDSLGAVISSDYDINGNLIMERDADDQALFYHYGRSGTLSAVRDNGGQVLSYSRDIFGNIVRIDRLSAGVTEQEMTIGRNRIGEIIIYRDAEGNEHRFEYDDNGNMICSEDPEHNKTRYSYTSGGLVSSVLYADGRRAEYEYDSMKRPVLLRDWNGEIRMEYDLHGELRSVVDPAGRKLEYNRDKFGRMEEIIYPDGRRIKYGYNSIGKLDSISGDHLRMKYEYDSSGRLIRKSSGSASGIAYEYRPDGRIAKISCYDAEGFRLSEETLYDAAGKIKGMIRISRNAAGTENEIENYAYRYDQLGRLTGVMRNGADFCSYAYDGAGNRTSMETGGIRYENTYNRLNQLVSQKVTENGSSYSILWAYDRCGRVVRRTADREVLDYHYDSMGKLAEIDRNGELLVSYKYNGIGMQIERFDHEKDKGLTFFYDPLKSYNGLLSISGSGQERDYIYDGQLAAEGMDKESRYYQCDRSGSVIRLLSEDGHALETCEYDPFGQPVPPGVEESIQPFGFAGMLYDGILKGYHTHAREYLPELGRFLQRDDERYIHEENPQSLNLYAYCLNDPLMFTDPSGNDSYIFFLPEWWGEALQDKWSLEEKFGNNGKPVHMISIDSNQELIDGWNGMGSVNGKPVSIDTVVINTHANQDVIGGESDDFTFGRENMGSLQNKNMDQLVLYGCNAGHLDFKESNIAAAFSGKVNGAPVMASDGTVSGRSWTGSYTSMGDEHFQDISEEALGDNFRQTNEGWQIYKQVDGRTTVTNTGVKSSSLTQMIDATGGRSASCGC